MHFFARFSRGPAFAVHALTPLFYITPWNEGGAKSPARRK